MSITTRLATALFLVALLAASALAQDSYRLEYKFQKGKTYRYRSVSAGNMTQEMMGKEMKMTNGSTMVTRTAVENVLPDGNIVLVASADSATIYSKSQMMDTTVVLNTLIGKRTRIVLSKLGKVLSREIIDSVKQESPFGGGNQRGMVTVTKLPDKEVKVGETWKDVLIDTIESMGGKIYRMSTLQFTLSGKEDKLGHNCLKIDYSGTISDTGKMAMGGMELYLEGGGKIKGTMYFDPRLGVTVFDEMTSDTEETMAVTGQQNMTIPMSQSMKTTRVLLGD